MLQNYILFLYLKPGMNRIKTIIPKAINPSCFDESQLIELSLY